MTSASDCAATSEEKVAKLTRFAHDLTRVEVDFSEIKNPRVADNELCEVTLHLPRHFVKAHAAATEQFAALDLTIDKLAHQLTRLKDKRVARNHPRRRQLREPASLTVERGTDDTEDRSVRRRVVRG